VVFCAIVFVWPLKLSSIEENSYLMPFLKELDSVLLMLINWIINQSPIRRTSHCVGCWSQEILSTHFANVGYLVLAFCVSAWECSSARYHLLFATKTNPFTLPQVHHSGPDHGSPVLAVPTIPMTLKSVQHRSGSGANLRFVVPLGRLHNMDSAIYFPCACIWLAVLERN
jgi:Na+/H+-dicarboxylate symporter